MDEIDPAQRLLLDQLSEEYTQRYGVQVEFLKAKVGAGDEYVNAAARVVISPKGAWFQCLDLPMEFSGMAGGPVIQHFLTDKEAFTLLDHLYALTEQDSAEWIHELDLFILYTQTGIVDGRGVYAFHHRSTEAGLRRPTRIGSYRSHVLPLAFRCRLNIDSDVDGSDKDESDLPMRRGVLFGITYPGEKHLLVEMPQEGDDTRDLGYVPVNPITQ